MTSIPTHSVWAKGPTGCGNIFTKGEGRIGHEKMYVEFFKWKYDRISEFTKVTVRKWLRDQPNFVPLVESMEDARGSLWSNMMSGSSDHLLESFDDEDRHKITNRVEYLRSLPDAKLRENIFQVSVKQILLSIIYRTAVQEIANMRKNWKPSTAQSTDKDVQLQPTQSQIQPQSVSLSIMRPPPSVTDHQTTSDSRSGWNDKLIRIMYPVAPRKKHILARQIVRDDSLNRMVDAKDLDHQKFLDGIHTASGWSANWVLKWEYHGDVLNLEDKADFEVAATLYQQSTNFPDTKHWDIYAINPTSQGIIKIEDDVQITEVIEVQSTRTPLGGQPQAKRRRTLGGKK